MENKKLVTPTQFIKDTAVTDLQDYTVMADRLKNHDTAKLVHYMVGMETEVGEIQDAVKKHIAYGKPLDRVNLVEELGDVLYYIARTIDLLGTSFEEVMTINNAKLKARYGEKFSEQAALNRDLEKERKILESGNAKS